MLKELNYKYRTVGMIIFAEEIKRLIKSKRSSKILTTLRNKVREKNGCRETTFFYADNQA
jgi:hypothetical protein